MKYMDRLDLRKTGEKFTVRLIASWLFANAVLIIFFGGDIGAKTYGYSIIPKGMAVMAVFFAVITLLSLLPWLKEKADYAALLATAYFASLVYVLKFREFILSAALIAVLAAVTVFCFDKGRLSVPETDLEKKHAFALVLAATWFSALFIGVFTVYRYLAFCSSNFDFGLFVNMFYNMKERFLPLVTSERDTLLSHFAVHISPAYYLLLPFFALVPRPETLLIVQAAVIVSGVVPLWLITKKYTLPNYARAMFCVAYLMYPALTGGAFYDFHENVMLTPLLLWMLYFYEKRKIPWMYVFAALVCMVKEDAPIYVSVAGLYLLLGRREHKHGTALFLGAIAYFAGAVALLNNFGRGAMTWRYANISDDGFFGIVTSVFVNPARVIRECLDSDKLVFLFEMLLPLLFLPLITKKISRYILLIPLVLVNLMPDYVYQHSIDFQYTYGVAALLFYLTVMNFADLEEMKPRFLLSVGSAASTILVFSATMSGKSGYMGSYYNNLTVINSINEVLEEIPEDASVTASTFLLPHIANRDLIYQYPSQNETEYIVLDFRGLKDDQIGEEYDNMAAKGYTLVDEREDIVALFVKKKH